MSAVPHAKAGVGSAVNDTTREVGGALGIAVLGSIANAVYRSSINLDGISLPPPVRAAAAESVGAATQLARTVPGAGELAARSATAYSHAVTVTSRVAVALALAAAAVVFKVFSRSSEQAAAARKPAAARPSATEDREELEPEEVP
jgi:hypothetical protein